MFYKYNDKDLPEGKQTAPPKSVNTIKSFIFIALWEPSDCKFGDVQIYIFFLKNW